MSTKSELKRARRALSRVTDGCRSRKLQLELRVQRLSTKLSLEAADVRPAPFLRVLASEHALAVLEVRLQELDAIAVGSSGQELGVRPTTPCVEVEDRKERRAARLAALPVRPGRAYVCHRCDNPACVAADHLFWGTATDNARDCAIKGRHGRSKTKFDSVEQYVDARREAIQKSIAIVKRRLERARARLSSLIER